MTAWANFTVTGGGACTCCGAGTVYCYLSLPPPIGDGAYADLATANGVINNQTDNCLVFAPIGSGGFITSLSGTQPAGNTAIVNYLGLYETGIPDVGRVWLGCSVGANTYINVAFSSVSDTYSTGFYYSNGASWGSISGSSNSALLTVADNYTMEIITSDVFGDGLEAIDVNVHSPNAINFCSIRANYASGGGYAWLNC